MLKGLIKCGYCGCAMIPTYSGKKVPGRGTFHYYRCNNTHKHVTEECQLKNISGAAIEEPIFNLVERLRIRNSRRPTSSTAHCRSRASRQSPTNSSRFPHCKPH